MVFRCRFLQASGSLALPSYDHRNVVPCSCCLAWVVVMYGSLHYGYLSPGTSLFDELMNYILCKRDRTYPADGCGH